MKKQNKNNFKKGTTIAELLITMAVVAVIGVVITSFTLAVNYRSSIESARYELMESETLAESVLNSYFETFDNKDYIFVSKDGKFYAVKREDEQDDDAPKFEITFEYTKNSEYESTLSIESADLWDESAYPNNPDAEHEASVTTLKYIEKISFNIENHTKTVTTGTGDEEAEAQVITDQLIICRLFYYIPDLSGNNNNISGTYIITYATRIN